jgi:hypothetical protein
MDSKEFSSLERGDVVEITFTTTETFTVDHTGGLFSVTSADGKVYNDRESAKFHDYNGGWDNAVGTGDIKLVKKAEKPLAEHLPVQKGDLWLAHDGKEYYAYSDYELISSSGGAYMSTSFKKKAKKLLHRAGNNH